MTKMTISSKITAKSFQFHCHRLGEKDTTALRQSLYAKTVKSRKGLSKLLDSICYEGDLGLFDCLMGLPDELRPALTESNNWPFKLAAASGNADLLKKIYDHDFYDHHTLTDKQLHQSLLFAAAEGHIETVAWLATTFSDRFERSFIVTPKCSGKIWEDLSSNVVGYKEGIGTLFGWMGDYGIRLPAPDWECLLYYALNNDATRRQSINSQVRSEDLFSIIVAKAMPEEIVAKYAKRIDDIVLNQTNDAAPKKLIMSIINEKRLRVAAGSSATPARHKI